MDIGRNRDDRREQDWERERGLEGVDNKVGSEEGNQGVECIVVLICSGGGGFPHTEGVPRWRREEIHNERPSSR